MNVDAVLLDIDGVLVTSWEAIPGAVETIGRLRGADVPFRLLTNTTRFSRTDMAATLRAAGFDVSPSEVLTAVVATGAYLRAHHPDARVALLTDGDPRADLGDVRLVPLGEAADVVVLGGPSDDFTYPSLNALFRNVMDGAALVAMHRNRYWRTKDGLQLDAGAYVAALEAVTGATATVCGKPAAAYFAAALEELGVSAGDVAMVGDDVENDVAGAQAAGIRGVLVRTGKFRPDDLERGDVTPDEVIGSIAELPRLLALEER
ncbi:MAG: TIGR01458 family HAD-type hydrolase [Actinomycetota bacterium]